MMDGSLSIVASLKYLEKRECEYDLKTFVEFYKVGGLQAGKSFVVLSLALFVLISFSGASGFDFSRREMMLGCLP